MCSNILKFGTLALIAALACTELQIVNDLHQHNISQAKLIKPAIKRTSTPVELGMGPAYSSDMAGDGPRKRTFHGDNYEPGLERVKKIRIY